MQPNLLRPRAGCSNGDHGRDTARRARERSAGRLGFDYVDLYVSEHLERIVQPAVSQSECDPGPQQPSCAAITTSAGPAKILRVEFESVAAAVEGIPFMSPVLGKRVYDHIRSSRPSQTLELGTAHGVSAAYMAAALEANGHGHVTTVDHGGAAYDPAPERVLAAAGLAHRVTIVRAHSSYNWYLKEQIEQASDRDGNCEPKFDFCYLDGSKNWNIDGLAVVLIEKLLRSDGWLLMDDLEWTYDRNPWIVPAGDGHPLGPLSERERTEPHLLAVFELIVKQHPAFTRFIREDAWYGWAQKRPDAPRQYEIASTRPLGALVASELRRRRWRTQRG